MFSDEKTIHDSLQNIWRKDIKLLEIYDNKLVLMSDIHLGNGGEADDFRSNENALIMALDNYKNKEYKLILLGDIEELWQFDLKDIEKQYKDTIYVKIKGFPKDDVFRIYGNHDIEWGGFRDPIRSNTPQTTQAYEALKLMYKGKPCFLLVHGHQGSTDCDKYSWISRFLARAFRVFEPLAKLTGLYGHKSATKSQIASNYERIMYNWAMNKKKILICGHSHRAIFASRSRIEKLPALIAKKKAEFSSGAQLSNEEREKLYLEIDHMERELIEEKERGRKIEPIDPTGKPKPWYFNTGCGLYTNGITAIEIADNKIKLVKWDIYGNNEVYEEEDLEKIVKGIR